MYTIELARSEDLPELPAIEREAASLFEGQQIAAAVLSDTTSVRELRHGQEAGLLWVARSADREVVGFALVELVAAQLHLEEIDVRPAHGRRGVGRLLIEAVLAWARVRGYLAITLTTFRDVPWNAPFYARLGFRALEPFELTPALAAIVQAEAARGLDPARRVVMRCELDRESIGASRDEVTAARYVTMARPSLAAVATATSELAAVTLGLSAGAMLAEGAVLVPWWRSMPPDAFLSWYASNASRLFDFFGPLEIASAVLAIAAAVLGRYGRRAARRWFIASAVLTAAVLGAFPVYFQEVNAGFAAGTVAPDRVGAELARWAWWHWGRTAIGLVAFATAVLGVRVGGEEDIDRRRRILG